jgi:sulfatase modifying factor 1
MQNRAGCTNRLTRYKVLLTLILALLAVSPASAEPPPGMVLVEGGAFAMGDWFHEGLLNERPVHTVFLSPFYIDAHEVTNQKYAAALNWAQAQGHLTMTAGRVFLTGGAANQPLCDTTAATAYSRITWNGNTFGVVAGEEHRPMVQVSWYGAAAFCNWRSGMEAREPCFDLSDWTCDFSKNGYRLPTEAEWEKAAAWDPIQQRHFRFGEHTDGCGINCLNGARANYANSGDPFDLVPLPRSTPVGYFNGNSYGDFQTQHAKSFYGCYDMSGNVWEWCYDWYSSTYYSNSPDTDPTGPASGTLRVQRGGSWNNEPVGCRTAMRNYHAPADRYPNDGFRCAVTRVPSLPGDLNCDNVVDNADAAALVLALLEPAAFADAYPDCSMTRMDMNDDGNIDGLDIHPFVVILTNAR